MNCYYPRQLTMQSPIVMRVQGVRGEGAGGEGAPCNLLQQCKLIGAEQISNHNRPNLSIADNSSNIKIHY